MFDLLGRQALYKKETWSFSGRMSVIDKNHAFSAHVEWEHQSQKEKIKLSGPFGLGRTDIILGKQGVVFSSAGKPVRYVGDVDDIVSKELGVRVPISALKYWVLGVTDPETGYTEKHDGFVQHGWRITYLQMVGKGFYQLPQKIVIKQGEAKLKLIVNHWNM